MDTITSNSPESTLALGEQWATEARPGWVIGLDGDLGAGKTHLVKGIARGLGITEPITSPTFTLVCDCLLYTSPSPRDATLSRMPSSA